MSVKEQRLYAKDCPELITDYSFFRDGMTCSQFEKEQRLFVEFIENGGNPKDYTPSFERK